MRKTAQPDSAADTDDKSDQSDSSDVAKKREAEMEETGEENAA